MTRKEIAAALHKQGYNCAQAVICAFSDILPVEADSLFKIAEGFGGGMGNNEFVCGAVSAAIMIAGIKNSNGINNASNKASTYNLSSEITKNFIEKNGSVICKELKGNATGKALRSCPGCIEDAVEAAEEIIFKK